MPEIIFLHLGNAKSCQRVPEVKARREFHPNMDESEQPPRDWHSLIPHHPNHEVVRSQPLSIPFRDLRCGEHRLVLWGTAGRGVWSNDADDELLPCTRAACYGTRSSKSAFNCSAETRFPHRLSRRVNRVDEYMPASSRLTQRIPSCYGKISYACL
ncbi:hypothetical protein BDW66DRAFT_75353 [Aspergillus desertorum]